MTYWTDLASDAGFLNRDHDEPFRPPCPQCDGFGWITTGERETVEDHIEDVLRSCPSCSGNGVL